MTRPRILYKFSPPFPPYPSLQGPQTRVEVKKWQKGLIFDMLRGYFFASTFSPFYPLFCYIFHFKGLLFDMACSSAPLRWKCATRYANINGRTDRASLHSATEKRTSICHPTHPQTYPIAAAFITHRTGICRAMQPHLF